MDKRERALGALWGFTLGSLHASPKREENKKSLPLSYIEEGALLTAQILRENEELASKRSKKSLTKWSSAGAAAVVGNRNQAATRILPLAIATPASKEQHLIELTRSHLLPTQESDLEISGAAAVAATISALIDGYTFKNALLYGAKISQAARRIPSKSAAPSIAKLIENAMSITSTNEIIFRFGTSSKMTETSPAAFACVVFCERSPLEVIPMAASIGGDSLAIAAIAGSIMGAIHGVAIWPEREMSAIEEINPRGYLPLVDALLKIREGELSQ